MRTVATELAIVDTQRDLNYQFAWNRYLMKIMGIWPEERKWNRPSSYIVLLPFLTMLCFAWGPQTINLPLIAHDLNLVVENLSMCNITVTIAFSKGITFWMKGESLKNLLKYMANDWATVETKTGRKRMMNIAGISRKITITCISLCYSANVAYVLLRLVFIKRRDNKLFFHGYFPYDVTSSPNFERTVFGQAIAMICSTTFYSTVDTFITMLILHACGQLSNLKEDLMKIHLYDKNNLHMKLKKIVQKHDYINRFSKTVENCFNVMLLVQMLGSIIQICFQTFQGIMSLEEELEQYMICQLVFLSLYTISVMMQLLLYCYIGERLASESTDIADTAYNCEWYSLPPKDARLLLIIMCRSVSSPLKLTAGKFCWFTILLYSQILRTSAAYISVLYAVRG